VSLARGIAATAAAITLAVLAAAPTPAAAEAGCPGAGGGFRGVASAQTLERLNSIDALTRPRPTGSAAQDAYIDWIGQRMRAIAGVDTHALRYQLERWRSFGAALSSGGSGLPLAGPVPYSRPAPGGVTAPLAFVAAGEPITPATAAGRLLVVEDPLDTYPYAVFFPGALGIAGYEPLGLDPDDPYARDSRSESTYMAAAEAAGAAGVLIAKDLPRRQIRGFYRPYGGRSWSLPGAFVGARQAQQLHRIAARGGSATLTLHAGYTPDSTRTLLADLPGARRGAGKLVVASHTDGTNALWDNGPVAMIAIARYLGRLPRRCRPR